MREFVRKLWRVWQHGFVIALVYGFTLIICFVQLVIVVYLGSELLGLNLNDHDWARLMIPLIIVGVPLGLGMGARISPTDDLKPADYSERSPSNQIER